MNEFHHVVKITDLNQLFHGNLAFLLEVMRDPKTALDSYSMEYDDATLEIITKAVERARAVAADIVMEAIQSGQPTRDACHFCCTIKGKE